MSKMMRILKSDDRESKQRQLTIVKNRIKVLTEEAELIELSLDLPKPTKKQAN